MIDPLIPFHPALDPDPLPLAVLSITPNAAAHLRIADDHLTITLADSAPLVYPLGDYTLTTLITALPSGWAGSVLVGDWAAVSARALTPWDGVVSANTAHRFDVYTSVLWRLVQPMRAALRDTSALLQQFTAMIDVRQASGLWLDLWGSSWNIPRLADEPDSTYRQRIQSTIRMPRSNGRAIEAIINQALNLNAVIVDDVGTFMTWNDPAEAWGPSAGEVLGPGVYGSFTITIDTIPNSYTADQLLDLINRYKAAGITFTLATRDAPEGVIDISSITIMEGA